MVRAFYSRSCVSTLGITTTSDARHHAGIINQTTSLEGWHPEGKQHQLNSCDYRDFDRNICRRGFIEAICPEHHAQNLWLGRWNHGTHDGRFREVSFISSLLTTNQAISIAVFALWVEETKTGIGWHVNEINPEQQQRLLKLMFIHGLINMNAVTFVKISVAFNLRRFMQTKPQRMFLTGLIGKY